MPSCGGFVRILRRRVVLGLIFALSLTYCGFSLFRSERKGLALDSDSEDMDAVMMNDNNDDLISDDDVLAEQLQASGKPPLWQMEILGNDNAEKMVASANVNDSDASVKHCRNSIQGKIWIVDERGIVCARHEVLPNGCCAMEQKQVPKSEGTTSTVRRERYSCKTCNAQGCCAIYEYCVSCCLHPEKQIKGKRDMMHKDNHKVPKDEDAVRRRLRNLDRFQICLAACRTSSASVQHENTYKDPNSKHCYTLQSAHQRHRRDVNSLNNNGDNIVVVTSSSVVPLLSSLSPYHCRCANVTQNERLPPIACN